MPIFEFLGLIFEWHDPKYELVNNERGYTIEEIASVFNDDYSVTIDDISGNYGEQRLLTTGISNQFRLITVVWVERSNKVRIITAFSPSKDQKRRYEYAKTP